MKRRWLRAGAVAGLVVLGAAAAGCDVQAGTDSRAVTVMENPWEITGAASNAGPTGARAGVPDAPLMAEHGDGGAVDKLSLNAVADIGEFWKTEYAKTFPGTFELVNRFVSWDATAAKTDAMPFCFNDTYRLVNAAYCALERSIGWDRGVLFPELIDRYGEMSVVMVLAHEYGHALQGQAKIAGFFTPALVKEQQADCLAGVFLRHVAEGNSAHFTLNTGDGLNAVLGATVAVRDRDPGDPESTHGSAFERITAVQLGYTDGAGACKMINRKEVSQRRGTLPTSFEPGEELGQLPVDVPSLTTMSQALAQVFPTRQVPATTYSGVVRDCPSTSATEPVSYCPSSNTVGTDVPELAEHGKSMQREDDPLSAMVSGDYNAFLIFISRYVLAVQQDRGMSLTGADTAGLRTACLSGVFTTALSQPGSNPRLSAGDLDEAVSGLLGAGLVASDVNGAVVASGYQRLEAFRTGVLEGETACLTRFR